MIEHIIHPPVNVHELKTEYGNVFVTAIECPVCQLQSQLYEARLFGLLSTGRASPVRTRCLQIHGRKQ